MKPFRKIIWAADPMESREIRSKALQVLRDLSRKTKARIEPVYVLSDGLLGLSAPKAKLIRHFKEPTENALLKLVKQSGLKNIAAPKILVCAPSSRGEAAEALDRYARSRGADLILVNSHGRHGVERAVMGSFAETLTMHSKTPVMITGPRTKQITHLNHVLFPTDFSKASKKAFEKVMVMARKLGARITILNVVVNPFEPFVQSGAALLGGSYLSAQGLTWHDQDGADKRAETWAAEARKKGLKVAVELDVDSTSVVLSVLSHARSEKVGLIAMASESSAMAALFLGSVGRGVGREAPCPVWFLRS